jgi:DNA excision repair protein ERCC-1
MKDAFEKPFYNKSASTISFPSQGLSLEGSKAAESESSGVTDKGKGKEKATALAEDQNKLSPTRPSPREASPVWDIELDLDDPLSPGVQPAQSSEAGRKRPPSPVWDIELDLNESDTEANSRKRHKGREDESDEF